MKLRTTVISIGSVLLLGTLVSPAMAARALPSYTAVPLDSPTPQARGLFGWVVTNVGNIDGDGVPDIAVGSPGENVGPFGHAGRVRVFSGRTRKVILTLDSPEAQSHGFGNFGASVVGLGDVNGDGVPDIAVGAFRQDVYTGTGAGCGAPKPNGCNENQGKVYVFSGSTGALLYTVDDPRPEANAGFGSQGAIPIGDVNGDGVRDFVEPALVEDRAGHPYVGAAYVFEGKDGTLLHTLDTPNPGDYSFSGTVSDPGDLTGDGVDDILVGAQGEAGGAGRAYLFDGKTGALVRTIESPAPQDMGGGFGNMITDGVPLGDVNGDGTPDLYVPAPGLTVGTTANVGRGYLLSGKDGSVIRPLDDPAPTVNGSLGYAFANAGDLDGDGTSDILVQRFARAASRFGPATGGAAYVFEPRTGAVLVTLPGLPMDGPGDGLASPGDVNGDGYPDYFLGGSQINGTGRVIVELSSGPPAGSPPSSPSPSPSPGSATPPTPTPRPPTPRDSRGQPRLSSRVTKRRHGVKTTFHTTGRLSLPKGVGRSACRGTISVQIKHRTRTVSRRRVALKRNCTFSQSTSVLNYRLRGRGRNQIIVRYQGTRLLKPASAGRRFA